MDAGDFPLSISSRRSLPALVRQTLGGMLLRLAWLTGGVAWIGIAASLCGCGAMNGYAMNRVGMAQYKRGHYAAAQQNFHRAMIDDPGNANYAYNLARSLERQGNIGGAEQLYQQTLAINPGHQPAYHSMSELLVAQGRPDEARAILATWAGSQPYSAPAHTELARFEERNGNPDAAAHHLATALQLQPRSPRALNEMARLQQEQGNPQMAAQLYQRSLAMQPFQPNVSTQISSLQMQGPAMSSGGPAMNGQFMQAGYSPQPAMGPMMQDGMVLSGDPALLPGNAMNGQYVDMGQPVAAGNMAFAPPLSAPPAMVDGQWAAAVTDPNASLFPTAAPQLTPPGPLPAPLQSPVQPTANVVEGGTAAPAWTVPATPPEIEVPAGEVPSVEAF